MVIASDYLLCSQVSFNICNLMQFFQRTGQLEQAYFKQIVNSGLEAKQWVIISHCVDDLTYGHSVDSMALCMLNGAMVTADSKC